MPKYKVTIAKKNCELIYQSKAMAASHPHKVEVAGSSPASGTTDIISVLTRIVSQFNKFYIAIMNRSALSVQFIYSGVAQLVVAPDC